MQDLCLPASDGYDQFFLMGMFYEREIRVGVGNSSSIATKKDDEWYMTRIQASNESITSFLGCHGC